jgi:hypothetical protein
MKFIYSIYSNAQRGRSEYSSLNMVRLSSVDTVVKEVFDNGRPHPRYHPSGNSKAYAWPILTLFILNTHKHKNTQTYSFFIHKYNEHMRKHYRKLKLQHPDVQHKW